MSNYEVLDITVEQQKPPWYWRMIGRQYWSGWRVKLRIMDNVGHVKYGATKAAPKPPNPHDVAAATAELTLKLVNRF